MKSVFISYGSPDVEFARMLNSALTKLGVITFFFETDAIPGTKLHRVMRDGVNQYDCVILICSKDSLERHGVRNEIEEVLQREAREGGSTILIPVRLDDYVFTDWAPDNQGIAQSIRDRVVADFRSANTDDNVFNAALSNLLEALLEIGDILPSYELINYEYEIFVLDPGGHAARIFTRRTLRTLSADITRLVLRDITASGRLEYVSTNIGKLEPSVDEGGKQTIYVTFDKPLPKDLNVMHELEARATDCYCKSVESVSLPINSHVPDLKVIIHLPKERPAFSADAVRIHRGQRMKIPGLSISKDNTLITFVAKNPTLGCIYVLEWKW